MLGCERWVGCEKLLQPVEEVGRERKKAFADQKKARRVLRDPYRFGEWTLFRLFSLDGGWLRILWRGVQTDAVYSPWSQAEWGLWTSWAPNLCGVPQSRHRGRLWSRECTPPLCGGLPCNANLTFEQSEVEARTELVNCCCTSSVRCCLSPIILPRP